ncbi:polymerase delta-interacting protein 3 [Thelohanellus kitauei]|uniref:Polymerase delta-interacting protein 3 n=1 Tax=Thelohanellus kitauei TaxID=669202 RepID=A0A0C2NEB0_THEKT|nr:polymerase delta-interacting protein 3 [Thelohanellus kitauei]
MQPGGYQTRAFRKGRGPYNSSHRRNSNMIDRGSTNFVRPTLESVRIPPRFRLGNRAMTAMKTKDRVDLKIQIRKRSELFKRDQSPDISIDRREDRLRQPQRHDNRLRKHDRVDDRFRLMDRRDHSPRHVYTNRDSTSSNSNKKIIIGNLHNDVTLRDIQDLFSSVSRDFTANRLHPGTIMITFRTSSDASRAMHKYNGRYLEGQRMIINLIQ